MTGRASRRTDTDALVAGVERIFVAPPEFDDALLGPAEVGRLLRCEEDAIAALVAAGLPAYGPGGDHLRRCDVMNVGLYCGSGRTIPEVAESHRVRFALEPRERWTEPRAWELSIGLACPREGCEAGTWRLAPPGPERFGGEVRAWPESPSRAASPWRADATVVAVGATGEVADPRAKELFVELVDELVDGDLRYQYLPPAIRRDPDAAAAGGALDCMAATLLLATRCEAAGIPTRTRKGMLLGAAGVEHVWLEVPAATADWAPLDPVLAALVAGAGDPTFVDFAAGSVTNRLLPWDLEANADLFTHTCGDGATVGDDHLQSTISARPLAA